MMHETSRLKAGLRALLDDLAQKPELSASACAMLQTKLDLYVSDELDGVDLRDRHPALWRHLQHCETCRAEHNSLLKLLVAEADAALVPLPRRAPVLPAASAPPWRVVFSPPDAPRPEWLFIFAPAYLRQSLQPATVVDGLRAAGGQPAPDALLVSYLGDTPAGEALVQVYARRDAADPTRCFFSLVAVAQPLPRAAVLTWGGQTWETALGPDGDGQLGPVPLAAPAAGLTSADAFALRILL